MGTFVGVAEGLKDGWNVGSDVLGVEDGPADASRKVGSSVLGEAEGLLLGVLLGILLGVLLGNSLGCDEGDMLGALESSGCRYTDCKLAPLTPPTMGVP